MRCFRTTLLIAWLCTTILFNQKLCIRFPEVFPEYGDGNRQAARTAALGIACLAVALLSACDAGLTPTPSPTPSPTPTATPTPPTDKEIPAAHLSQLIQWFGDPPDGSHALAAEELAGLWFQDAGFGGAVAAMPWVADGISSVEASSSRACAAFTASNKDLAWRVLGYPWLADGLTHHEQQTLQTLSQAGGIDPAFAHLVASLSWLADDATSVERITLQELFRTA